MSSVSNGLYFLTLPLVSVMRAIYRKIRQARYLYIKRNVEKVWGARYTLGARYLSKNTVIVNLSDFAGGSVSRHARYWVSWTVTETCGTGCPHVARVLPKFKAQYFLKKV